MQNHSAYQMAWTNLPREVWLTGALEGRFLCMQDDIYKKMTAKGWYLVTGCQSPNHVSVRIGVCNSTP